MRRLSSFGLFALLTVFGCTWPPKPSVPSTPSPGDTVQQGTNGLPQLPGGTLAAPTVSVPKVSVPRSGGLFGR